MRKETKITIGLTTFLIIYILTLYLLGIRTVWVGLP